MVVGADVEARVILAVVPSDEALVVLAAALRLGVDRRLSLFDLCQQPAARDDGVRAEQLGRRGGAHLRRDDALEIRLNVDTIHHQDAVARGREDQRPAEALVFAALPVEVYADGDAPQVERVRGVGGLEVQRVERVTLEGDVPVSQRSVLLACVRAARLQAAVGAVEMK